MPLADTFWLIPFNSSPALAVTEATQKVIVLLLYAAVTSSIDACPGSMCVELPKDIYKCIYI